MSLRVNPRRRPVKPRPQDCIHIEFFGLPGSGKTTVAQEVYTTLSRALPDLVFSPDLMSDGAGTVARVASKLRLFLYDFIGERAGGAAARKVLLVPQARLRDRLRAVFTVATMVSLYAALRQRRCSAVIDQGVLQALWSVQIRATGGTDAALFDDMLDAAASGGQIYVSVETPVDVCAKRLAGRKSKHSRMQDASADQDPRAWEIAERLRQTLLADLGAAYQRCGITARIISVDGTAKPAETAGQIVAALERYMPATVSPQPEQLREVMA